jgi:hypothetical protein
MIRLGGGGLARYYLCTACRTVRLELASAPGLMENVCYLPLDSQELPEPIRMEGQALMTRPRYTQASLF